MATRVLIVLDGKYRFQEPAEVQDFTFTELVNTLKNEGFIVTRAHKKNLGSNAEANGEVDINEFDFAARNLLEYDVIWIIGYDGRNVSGTTSQSLSDSEIGAITEFMNAGGGIFATGDHDSIGANMCGFIPRVRIMRAWFGQGGTNTNGNPIPVDPGRPDYLSGFPYNFFPIGGTRADTVQRNPLGDYDRDNDGVDDDFVWFENQSDSIPQPLSPTNTPAHPILRRNDRDIVVYPDHMHEGQTLGEQDFIRLGVSNPYTRELPAGVSPDFVEFPTVDGTTERPKVIATGQGLEYVQRDAVSGGFAFLDSSPAMEKTINTLCVYDGRRVGVGRVVTGSTFHHYIDINLTGDTDITGVEQIDRTGPDAAKGQGFNYPGAEETYADIKAVFINITKWLARATPKAELILERSTFSADEVNTDSTFEGVI